ncbi:response regulator [Thalassospira sp. GO-4]|uniref:response regulator transcription factor n=1 Tax=unclassified Thalassospira TaxID=2648997 RepID=UPI0018D32612|nr:MULTISPECIES: response regulator [unclassified Thalassospira]URK17492.1 response regulator [Thalassospira sp. GO-4]
MKKLPMVSIIDDDESVRSATASLLRSLGYNVRTFSEARSFLDHPERDNTTCIITDIQMPSMTGLELQQVLLAEHSQIPMIFVTGFPNEQSEKVVRRNGAKGFFAKPFQAQELIDCLEDILSRSD